MKIWASDTVFRRNVASYAIRSAKHLEKKRGILMKLKHLGLFGVVSLLSYTAMVVLSPLAYPGYDWLSMAVSDLSAVGAPSAGALVLAAAFFPHAKRYFRAPNLQSSMQLKQSTQRL